MLICKVNSASIDTSGDFLADLMRIAPCNHIQLGPPVFNFRTDGSADEKVEFFLGQRVCLEVVGLYMVCNSLCGVLDEAGDEGQGTYGWDQLGVADTRKAGPANLGKGR